MYAFTALKGDGSFASWGHFMRDGPKKKKKVVVLVLIGFRSLDAVKARA